MTAQHDYRPRVARRTTDTPLEMPSLRRVLSLGRRALRLRCPHCGGGPVLRRWFSIHDRCTECHFRYERSDENYFAAAVFVHYMVSGVLFVASFLAVLVLSWPDVPWNVLTYGVPVAMVVGGIVFYPVSKVIWLAVDVMVRPVTSEELV